MTKRVKYGQCEACGKIVRAKQLQQVYGSMKYRDGDYICSKCAKQGDVDQEMV